MLTGVRVMAEVVDAVSMESVIVVFIVFQSVWLLVVVIVVLWQLMEYVAANITKPRQ